MCSDATDRTPSVGCEEYAEILRRLDALQGPAPAYFTVRQAAVYTSLSQESIRQLIERRDLTALRPVRGRILIAKRELDDLVLGSTRRPVNSRGYGRRRGAPGGNSGRANGNADFGGGGEQ